jgi:hypothetical protein
MKNTLWRGWFGIWIVRSFGWYWMVLDGIENTIKFIKA